MTEKNPPSWIQAGSHPAEDDRRLLHALTAGRKGVTTSAGLAVTQRGAGANMSVDVAAGRAWLLGTEATFQGSYFVENRGTTNLVVAAAHATLARIDLVVARVQDQAYSGATNAWSLAVVTGTPAGSPVAPAAPVNSIILGQIAVGAAAASIVNANITDRRFDATISQEIVPSIQAKASFRAVGATGLANGVATALTYDTVDYSTDIGLAGSVMTVNTAGIYVVTAKLVINNLSVTGYRYMSLLLNGASVVDVSLIVSASVAPSGTIAESFALKSGDTLQITGFQNTGGTINANGKLTATMVP